jgi:hypothetical protein
MPEKWESLVIISELRQIALVSSTKRRLPFIAQTPLECNGITLPAQGATQVTEAIGCVRFSGSCPPGKQKLEKIPYLAALGGRELRQIKHIIY